MWFLDTWEIKSWFNHTHGTEDHDDAVNILWLHGNPGTGKSTMALFLAEEFEKQCASTNNRILAYFFCDAASEHRQTATAVLRGLLFQICRRRRNLVHDYLLPEYQVRKNDLLSSFDGLWNIFVKITADKTVDGIYCIIDALDECDEISQDALLHQLQQTFGDLKPNDSMSKLHILVTSRPYSNIHEWLDDFTNMDLASFDESKKDVEAFIAGKVADLAKRKHYTSKLRDEVERSLNMKAEGTFLWVGLAYEELLKKASKDALKLLADLPPGLESIYQRQLNQALQEAGLDKGDIIQILSLVSVSLRPLSLLELSIACQLHEEEEVEERIQFTRDSIASCRLMVVVQDDMVHLLHKSVKDFLTRSKYDRLFHHLVAHAHFAERCIDYLLDRLRVPEQIPAPKDPFLFYAAQNWVIHARLAESEFEVKQSQADFFTLYSEVRERWLASYRETQQVGRRFSIFHVAAHWDIPGLIDYGVSAKCLEESSCLAATPQTELERFAGLTDSRNETVLQVAASLRHVAVIRRVLHHFAGAITGPKKKFTEQNGNESPAQAVHRSRSEILITRDVVMAAAGTHTNGDDVMSLLLDSGGQDVVTEEVVKTAARNWSCGQEVMTALLNRGGDQVVVTEKVVKAAAQNKRSASEVMTLLLDRRGDQVVVTEEVVKAAAQNGVCGQEVMTLLLDRRGDQVVVTEEVVKAAAQNGGCGQEVMTLLLDRRGDQVVVTEEVVKAAARNRVCGQKVMTLLLDRRGDQVVVTEEVVKAAAQNEECGQEVMTLLLDRRGDQVVVTEEVVKAAAGNWNCGQEVMTLLLDRQGDQVVVTEEVVMAAAQNEWSGSEVVALLLDRRGDQVVATEEEVTAAAQNERGGQKATTLLLDRRDQVVVTEEAVKAIAARFDEKVVTALMNRQTD